LQYPTCWQEQTARHPRCKKLLLARRALGRMANDLGGGKLKGPPKNIFLAHRAKPNLFFSVSSVVNHFFLKPSFSSLPSVKILFFALKSPV
jgi:hypothetical protein